MRIDWEGPYRHAYDRWLEAGWGGLEPEEREVLELAPRSPEMVRAWESRNHRKYIFLSDNNGRDLQIFALACYRPRDAYDRGFLRGFVLHGK